MTIIPFNLVNVHPSWLPCVKLGLSQMNENYLRHLLASDTWLPGKNNLFNAFSLPLEKVNYVLFGESPYPRAESANGYAFWDAAIGEIWSPTGFSKKANRATSFRNILKMLLVAEGVLSPKDTSQTAIAHLNKQAYVKTNSQLFNNLLDQGFLLLNTTLVLSEQSRKKEAKEWSPFIQEIIKCLLGKQKKPKFILLGQIAQLINHYLPETIPIKQICAEHPYNNTFINNDIMLNFFRPFKILMKK